MNEVTIDEALRERLNGLKEQTIIYGEDGCRLGYFLPAKVYSELIQSLGTFVFPEEEIGQLKKQTGGRSLAEIWQSLGQQ